MQNYLEVEKTFHKISNLNFTLNLLHWDSQVMMPVDSSEVCNSQITTLENIIHEIKSSPNLSALVKAAQSESLNDYQKANLKRINNILIHSQAVPAKLVEKLSNESLQCEYVWRTARFENDFNKLMPYLRDLVNTTREISTYKSQKLGISPYDSLMDLYDPGRTVNEVDPIFKRLEEFLPDFIKKVTAKQENFKPINVKIPEAEQSKFGKIISEKIGLDYKMARLDKTLHPFCGGNPLDIRITSRYDENNFISGLMGIIHETGHAMYEKNLPRDSIYKPAGQSCSMTLHESQSLFAEMQLCSRIEFLTYVSTLLKEELNLDEESLSAKNLYSSINYVQPSFIRVDADEVTYPLHIIMRYNIEKALISSEIEVSDIPAIWDELMQKYLGIKPKNHAEGCLQDIHWPSGNFGYFPCYSLGAILAAQLKHTIDKIHPNASQNLINGDFKLYMEWLKNNFHSLASTMSVKDIIRSSTGEDLNIEIYIDYLKSKYDS